MVLTGEEIELPGEDSDASAIIGESSEPIHTGEIEAVAIGGLTGRVPAAAPLKPTIEDKISTGELPVVTASEGDLPIVSPTDEAEDTAEVSSDDSADTVSEEVADQQEEPAEDNAPANEEPRPSRSTRRTPLRRMPLPRPSRRRMRPTRWRPSTIPSPRWRPS